MDLRLVPAAIAAWVGAFGLIFAPAAGLAALLAAVALAVCAGIAWAAVHRARLRAATAGTILAACAVGGVAAAVCLGAPIRAPDLAPYEDRTVVAVYTVDSTARALAPAPGADVPDRAMRDVTVREIRTMGEAPRGAAGLALRARLIGPVDDLDELAVGSTVESRIRIERADLPGSAWVEPAGPIAVRAEPDAASAAANAVRDAFAGLARGLPGDGGGLLPGLATGDTSGVPPPLHEAMRASGLSHLTAVSGANCAIVVGAVLALLRLLGVGRAGLIAGAIAALAGFVLLVTPEPSVVRASTMAVLVLLAHGAGRRALGIGVLALAVLLLLVTDPWLSVDAGFALSVLATGGLILLAEPLAHLLARLLPRALAAALAVPAAAQLACLPVLVLLDPGISLLSIPANLLAGPAAAVATVLGLLACLLAIPLPPLALPLSWIAWMPAAFIAGLANAAAAADGAVLDWPGGEFAPLLAAVVCLTLAALVLRSRRGVASRAVRGTAAVLALAVLAWAGWSVGGPALRRATLPADWAVAACDIGQGDAVLVAGSAGERMLVDLGPDPERLAACLRLLGVGRIGLLIVTHYDLDHVGGVAAVAGIVDSAVLPPAPAGDGRADAVRRTLEDGGARILEARAGDELGLGTLEGEVLWPPDDGAATPTGNAGSIVVSVGTAVGRVLLLGDLGELEQSRLLREGAGLRADVVKVAHHGSADQSPALYEAAGAGLALVSVGADNGYGHPTPSLLELLARVGTPVLRTDLEGTIVLAPGPASHADDARRAPPPLVWSSGPAAAVGGSG